MKPFPVKHMYLFPVFNSYNSFSWFLCEFPEVPRHDFGSIQVCTNLCQRQRVLAVIKIIHLYLTVLINTIPNTCLMQSWSQRAAFNFLLFCGIGKLHGCPVCRGSMEHWKQLDSSVTKAKKLGRWTNNTWKSSTKKRIRWFMVCGCN